MNSNSESVPKSFSAASEMSSACSRRPEDVSGQTERPEPKANQQEKTGQVAGFSCVRRSHRRRVKPFSLAPILMLNGTRPEKRGVPKNWWDVQDLNLPACVGKPSLLDP